MPTSPENAPDRRTDPEGRERWDALARHYDDLAEQFRATAVENRRLHRTWLWVLRAVLVGLAVLVAAVALAFVRQGQQTDAIKETTERIDTERFRNVRDACMRDAMANRTTKAVLRERYRGDPARLAGTEALIDALAPNRTPRECTDLARTQVASAGDGPPSR